MFLPPPGHRSEKPIVEFLDHTRQLLLRRAVIQSTVSQARGLKLGGDYKLVEV